MRPPLFKPAPLTLTLKERRQLTHDVYEFEFHVDSPEDFNFEAGQFMTIDVPNTEKVVKRAYSIASKPALLPRIDLCIKMIPEGLGSTYLMSLNEGDTVTAQGPFGIFVMKDDYEENFLFVGTGTGIAPLKSMLEFMETKGMKNPSSVLFGVRHEKDLFYGDFFKDCENTHTDFCHTSTLSRPEDSWEGDTGRVTAHLTAMCDDGEIEPENTRVFICGIGVMIEEVAKMCEEHGIPKDRIHHEKFF